MLFPFVLLFSYVFVIYLTSRRKGSKRLRDFGNWHSLPSLLPSGFSCASWCPRKYRRSRARRPISKALNFRVLFCPLVLPPAGNGKGGWRRRTKFLKTLLFLLHFLFFLSCRRGRTRDVLPPSSVRSFHFGHSPDFLQFVMCKNELVN